MTLEDMEESDEGIEFVPFPVSWTVKMKKNRKKRRISCRITLRRRDAQTRHAQRHPEDASQ